MEESAPRCLAIHGLGGGPYELNPLTDALASAGFHVESPTLAGHDGPGPSMPASTWRDWTEALERRYDEVAAAGPMTVVGFSTGALIALHLAAVRQVDRLVLIAPFFAIRYTDRLPFRAARVLGPFSRLMEEVPRRRPAVRDPAARRLLATLDRFRTFNLRAALSALEFIERIEPIVPKIQAPTLILQGRLDTVVEPARATSLLARLGSTHKCLVILERSDHLAAYDYDRERLIHETLTFLGGEAEESICG